MVPAVRRVLTRQVRIGIGAHPAATAPRLVPDPPERHPPRRVPPVRAPQVRHRRGPRPGEVLDPLAHLADRAGPDVARDVRLGTEHLAQRHELVRAEVVVLLDVAPVGVDHPRAVGPWPDSVTPVVLVRETPPRPAQVGDAQLAQRLHHVLTDPTHVRDRGVLAHPESAVDAPSQVLSEVAVQVTADDRSRNVHVDDDGRTGGLWHCGSAFRRGSKDRNLGHDLAHHQPWVVPGHPVHGSGHHDRRRRLLLGA